MHDWTKYVCFSVRLMRRAATVGQYISQTRDSRQSFEQSLKALHLSCFFNLIQGRLCLRISLRQKRCIIRYSGKSVYQSLSLSCLRCPMSQGRQPSAHLEVQDSAKKRAVRFVRLNLRSAASKGIEQQDSCGQSVTCCLRPVASKGFSKSLTFL